MHQHSGTVCATTLNSKLKAMRVFSVRATPDVSPVSEQNREEEEEEALLEQGYIWCKILEERTQV